MADDRAIRIISAVPAVAELQLNELMGNYVPILWNISPGADGLMVTAVLIHQREVRRAQIAAPALPGQPLRMQ